HSTFPNVIMIAEESTAWPGVTGSPESGGLGFDFKWNMGWMHDTLEYFSLDPVYRKYHQNIITFTIWYAFSESFILPLSHDEVVHMKGSLYNKMPGDEWQKMANLRCLYAFMFLSPGKKLVFMGSEWGQHEEWNVKEGLRWEQASYFFNSRLVQFFKDSLYIYKNYNLAYSDQDPSGFEWIDFSDYNQSVLSFIRKVENNRFIIAIFNLTPVPRVNYRIGVPQEGFYKEILNSDSEIYGGSNMGNFGGVSSERKQSHNKDNSISITLPPLSCVVFSYNSD
ncbi:MAG: alpha amylase C-terminal domain-containing protein, partial [Thermoplasmatales archaeon]